MIAVYLASAAVLVVSAAVGHAICARTGGDGAGPPWAPAVGLAALLVLARLAIELPGRATTAAIVVGVAGLAALATPGARVALRSVPLDRVVIAIGVLLVASLPFLSAGRVGILGMGDNNDMSAHLTAAWWLDTHGIPEPLSATRHPLVSEGYPFGPHALAAALSRGAGISLVPAFGVLTLVGPVLTALAALAAVPARAPRPIRWIAAGLVGLAYLPVSYLAQGAFKETLLGMLVVAFALAARDLIAADTRPGVRAGIPLGVLAAGAFYVYSVPGALWPLGTAAVLLVLELVRRRAPRDLMRAALPAVAGAAATFVVVAAFEIGHISDFLSSSFAAEPDEGLGNLHAPIPLAEALGIWPRGDFRFHPHPFGLTVALDLLALVALLGALAWWLRRRDHAVIAGLVAAGLVAWWSHASRSPYNTAKSLAILAPLVALTLFPALAAAWRRARPGATGLVACALGAIVAAGAAASSFVALRDAPVGPRDHERQLRSLVSAVGDARVLYLNADDFTQWELRGTRPATVPLLYTPAIAPRWWRKPQGETAPVDFDSFDSDTLDGFDYVVTSAAGYQSRPTPNFRVVRRTSVFLLWRREGTTPVRRIIEGASDPGAILDCSTAQGRRVLAAGGSAAVLLAPVVGARSRWTAQPATNGTAGAQTLSVPAGRWDVSLQYVSRTALEVRVLGLRLRVPANLERLSTFWPAGTVVQERSGPLTIRVIAGKPGWVGRWLDAPARTRALGPRHHAPLGRVALTRSGARPRIVPVRQACGRYVDWYVPAG